MLVVSSLLSYLRLRIFCSGVPIVIPIDFSVEQHRLGLSWMAYINRWTIGLYHFRRFGLPVAGSSSTMRILAVIA